MSFIFLTLGLWRSWLGGGIPPKGRNVVQVLTLAAICVGATWGDWVRGGVSFLALFAMARIAPHGPMNKFPLGEKSTDFILRAVGGPGGGVGRYLAYAGLRYGVLAGLWAGALQWLGYVPYGPLAGTVGLVLVYLAFTVTVSRGASLPTFTHPGDEAGNWGELTGWTVLGAALVITEYGKWLAALVTAAI